MVTKANCSDKNNGIRKVMKEHSIFYILHVTHTDTESKIFFIIIYFTNHSMRLK